MTLLRPSGARVSVLSAATAPRGLPRVRRGSSPICPRSLPDACPCLLTGTRRAAVGRGPALRSGALVRARRACPALAPALPTLACAPRGAAPALQRAPTLNTNLSYPLSLYRQRARAWRSAASSSTRMPSSTAA
jgi:hypothetical protein